MTNKKIIELEKCEQQISAADTYTNACLRVNLAFKELTTLSIKTLAEQFNIILQAIVFNKIKHQFYFKAQ